MGAAPSVCAFIGVSIGGGPGPNWGGGIAMQLAQTAVTNATAARRRKLAIERCIELSPRLSRDLHFVYRQSAPHSISFVSHRTMLS
jgi:hypothetical protein